MPSRPAVAAAVLLAIGLSLAAVAGTAPPAGDVPLDATYLANATARTPPPSAWKSEPYDATQYFEPAELAKWKRFRNRQRFVDLAYLPVNLVFYLLFLLPPVSTRLLRVSERVARAIARLPGLASRPAKRIGGALSTAFGADWAACLVFAQLFGLVGLAVDLPGDILGELFDQHAGLSNYTAAKWIWDLAKSELLYAIVLSFLVFGLFGLIRRMSRRWWLALGIPAGLLLFGYGVVAPYRARVFYDFHPLHDAALRADLEALAHHEGLSLSAIKVVVASRTTNGVDAYFTGVGPSRELVLFDNLLRAFTHKEIEVAVSHELGHLRHEDVTTRYTMSAVAIVVFLWLIAFVLRRASPKLGLDGPGDIRALPLLFFVVFVLLTVIQPAENRYSRHEERQADRVALTLTGDPDDFISMQVKLARINKADVHPSPLVMFWYGSHPSVYERIGTARWYRGWLDRHHVAHIGHPPVNVPPGGAPSGAP